MKQLLQDMANGELIMANAPSPSLSPGKVLIATTRSLISTGTERMLVDFAKASYLEKARQQPEKVKLVLEKIKTDGLITTIDAVRSKLAEPLALGYCNVGTIIESSDFKKGARVVSNGPHADIVQVSKHLCALIPDAVDDETAAFTVVASIGLQGIRLAAPTLGECFVVTGVGLIGLLTVQLLKAQGCRVLAIDMDCQKLQLAQQFGAEICNPSKGMCPVAEGLSFSRGRGVDGVIITASTTSNDPVSQAAQMSRKRGRIILVGVVGLALNRADFYEKELSFQVSCSYGPGRYEADYEEKGIDYPVGLVRWSEQRNFEAVLDMMAAGQLNLKPLMTHRFAFENAMEAYQILTQEKTALGILLHYASAVEERHIQHVSLNQNKTFDPTKPILGVIGAGNYATRQLFPAFKAAGGQCHTIVTQKGISGVIHGKKWGFISASTDITALLHHQDINTIVIVTRHNLHADLVVKALTAGKHVFVEKPLAITREGLAAVESSYHMAYLMGKKCHLMVGFNRRFSVLTQKMKALLAPINEPKTFIMTINAGSLPANHWTQNPDIGGGRILGEACHFIDLMRFLVGTTITSVQAKCVGSSLDGICEDKAVIVLGFADGSFGTIHYFANGARTFPKERIEVFCASRILQLDNFLTLRGFGWPNFKKMRLWKQDKGQKNTIRAFLQAIEHGESGLIPAAELFEVAKISLDVSELLQA